MPNNVLEAKYKTGQWKHIMVMSEVNGH